MKYQIEKAVAHDLSVFSVGDKYLSESNPFVRNYIYKEEKIKGIIVFSVIYDRIELDYIEVLPSYRNQHIASSLLEYLLEQANSLHSRNITLEVNVHNVIAIHLYQKYGFKIRAIRRKYYGIDDAYLMERVML